MVDLTPTLPPTVVTVSAFSTGTGSGLVRADGHPVIIQAIQPLMIILVRATRVFLQTLVGLITAGLAAPKALPAADFLHLVILCASISVAPAAMCVLQNAIELLSKLDQKYPSLTT